MKVALLKPSAIIDLAQLITSIRPAARTQISDVSRHHVQRLAWQLGFFTSADADGFVVFSRSQTLSCRILSVDKSSGNHTYVLGRLLGYPACCCRAAAKVGDRALDAWAQEISSRCFVGRFKAISPAGYSSGRALISHVPCSESCLPSLWMALSLRAKAAVLPRTCRGTAAIILRAARLAQSSTGPSGTWQSKGAGDAE